MGLAVTDEVYAGATALRNAYSERFRATLGMVDAVACPAGGVPFPLSAAVQYGHMAGFDPHMGNLWLQFTLPADFAGTPSISLPCGVTDYGVPHTIQFLGAHLSEPTLCRIARAYEEATDWHTMHPAV